MSAVTLQNPPQAGIDPRPSALKPKLTHQFSNELLIGAQQAVAT